jgi:CBS domain-containing protein
MTKLVREVMARVPLSIDARMSIESAAAVMRRRDVGELLVTDDGYLCGTLTARDIAVWSIAAGRHPATILAGECCDGDEHQIAADAPAEDALELLQRNELQYLPVTDGGRLVGAVWITDVLAATVWRHRSPSRPTKRRRPAATRGSAPRDAGATTRPSALATRVRAQRG